MSNDYDGQPLYSKHVTELMRRINALEASCGGVGALFNRKFGTIGSGNGQFNCPEFVFVFNNEVFVTDSVNHRVQVFDLNGAFLRKWGSYGTGDGQFKNPRGIYIYDGEVFVTETTNNRIQVFDLNGVFIRKWGSHGTGDGQFVGPYCVQIFNDEVFVSDSINHRIQVFSLNGSFLRKWGTQGNSDGQFQFPAAVFIFENEVFVGDSNTHGIQVFGLDGIFKRKFGANVVSAPSSMFILGDDIYVIDYTLHCIHVFSKDGVIKQRIGSYGDVDGFFRYPTAIYIYEENVFVVDRGNNRVQIFLPYTTFYAYQESEKESLGTPDAGVTIPTNNALCDAFGGAGAGLLARHIIDMRVAIMRLCSTGKFIAPSGNPYFLIYGMVANSPDNLYYAAMGDRTKYGATGGPRYWWTRRDEGMLSYSPLYGIDIGEIAECVATLEAAPRA